MAGSQAFRTLALVVSSLAVIPRPGAAQLPQLMPPGSQWIDVNYPKVFWTPREGLTGGAYLGFIRQHSFETADAAAPYSAAVALDGQMATSGSRQLSLESRFPAFIDGWRFSLLLEGARRVKENYYGLGNESIYDEHLVTDSTPGWYQVRAMRWFARGEVQRRLIGGLRVLAGFHAENWRFSPHSRPTKAGLDQSMGVDPRFGLRTNDVAFRAGLIYDTRDDEVAPNRGLLLQVIGARANAAGTSYTRTTVSGQAYREVSEKLGLAVRIVGQGMGGTPHFGSYYLVESSDRPYVGLGGSMSHRALFDNRFLGRHKLLFNLDARFHVVNVQQAARITILGFFDAGRVFEGEPFKVTTTGLKVGAGTGLFFQLARAGVVGMTLGYGPHGAVLDFATRWTY